jgi:hypothetical protein
VGRLLFLEELLALGGSASVVLPLRCNFAIIDDAERLAGVFDDADPVLLTVWNGNPGDGKGGTVHAVEAWKQREHRLENVDVSKV